MIRIRQVVKKGALFFFLSIFICSTSYANQEVSNSIENTQTDVETLRNSDNKALLQLNSGLTSTFSQMDLNSKLGLLAVGMQNNQVLLWQLNKHEGPRRLLPPVLGEQSKRSHPVALDPQGRWVAYGVPSSQKGKANLAKIFLFDLLTGKVIKVLDQLESRAQSIRFSKDGNYLAASLSSGYGLRIWSSQNWRLVQKQDPLNSIPLKDQANLNLQQANHPGLAFNSNNNARVALVMAGGSGIWCFGQAPAFSAVACLENSSDSWIPADDAYNSVAFSPNGDRIALGSLRSDRILLLPLTSSYTPVVLSPPKRQKNHGKSQYLSEVAWSSNGRYIYAGGVYWLARSDSGLLQNSIVRWDLQSNNTVKLFATGGTDIVMDLVSLDSQGIMYATQDPIINTLNGQDELNIDADLFPIQSGNFNMRYWKEKNFVASKNGQVIALKSFGENEHIQFDLQNRDMSYIDKPLFEQSVIFQPAPSVSLQNIINVPYSPADKRRPMLNGKALPLNNTEISRDYAFLPSGKEFIWASSEAISFIQADGVKKWSKKSKYEGLRVILANAGKLTIVTHSDGAIRWYLTETGQQLLTLFIARPKVDREIGRSTDWKWIAWTPEGFYSSSEAGEEMIGWLINDSENSDNPIYYNFGTFREKFYRPDIIEQILTVHSIEEAFKIANANAGFAMDEKMDDMLSSLINNAPPSIEILSPIDSDVLQAGPLDVCFKLRSPAKSPNVPKEVNIFLSAGLIKRLTENIALNKKICQQIDITESLALKKGRISLKLSVQGSATSIRGVQQASRLLAYKNETVKEKKTRLLGLFVGISQYDQANLKLDFAEKDAEDMALFWNAQKNHPYSDIQIKRIKGSNATRDEILSSLDSLQKKAKADDVVILYFAGHGATLLGNNRYLFFTRSANTGDTKKLLASSVTDLDLNNALSKMKSRFKMVIMDTCRNIIGPVNPQLRRVDSTALRNEVVDFWNAHAFFSTGEKGYAQERDGNGIYTAAFLQALKGEADFPPFKDNAISIAEIDRYTYEMVRHLTKGSQEPILITPDNLEVFKHKPPVVTLKPAL